ncbi:MAG TPA: spore coat associated protein CotJA [Clostridiaceae bacterium]|nr:spore coat associated protein CotJA [Clostridiaceae bacterium]
MCIPQETVICNVRLARAYVPFQRLCSLYSPEEALNKGTAFPELYSPYYKAEKSKTKISPLTEKSGDDYE